MTSPAYQVRLRASGTNFAPGDIIVELENAKNIGWSEYLNGVGEAFFTLTQGDPKAALVGEIVDEMVHCQILRDGALVWAGWLGETDETETDVIFYAYSYVAALFWLHSDWAQSWTGETVGTIITVAWTRAQTTLSDSALAWVTTGATQNPWSESGGPTDLVLPEYTVNYKRILFLMQELSAMAISDTSNHVVFEITPDGTFNLWRNRERHQTGVLWEYGGVVVGFNRIRLPLDSRNVILGVGSAPNDVVLRKTHTAPTDMTNKSRKEEAVYYSWVRDNEEMERVNKLRRERAKREDNQLMLSFLPNSVIPARATGATFRLGDFVPVKINHGATVVDGEKLVTGQQVIVHRGEELVRALVQDSF